MGELDSELKKIKMQRDNTQKGLNSKLQNNRSEQEQLRERLRQLENEDADLSNKIDQNNKFQAEADQVFKQSCNHMHAHHIYVYYYRSMKHVKSK